jgi:hypothetical protein
MFPARIPKFAEVARTIQKVERTWPALRVGPRPAQRKLAATGLGKIIHTERSCGYTAQLNLL